MLRDHEIYQNFRSPARNIYQAGFRAGVTEIQLAVAVSLNRQPRLLIYFGGFEGEDEGILIFLEINEQ